MTFDQQIPNTCNKRRPDVFIDCYTHVVIVEIDENAHNNYDTSCEIARINELFTGFADRSIIFIRFNPDAYRDNTGKRVLSCFKQTAHDVPTVSNKTAWNRRLQTLRSTIRYYCQNIPDATETVKNVFLYYDDYDNTDTLCKELDTLQI